LGAVGKEFDGLFAGEVVDVHAEDEDAGETFEGLLLGFGGMAGVEALTEKMEGGEFFFLSF